MRKGKYYENHSTLALAMHYCSEVNPKVHVYNNDFLINNLLVVEERITNEIEDKLNFDNISNLIENFKIVA